MSQFIQSSITLVCRLLTKEDGPPPSNVTYFEGEITARNEESAFGMPTVTLKTKLINQAVMAHPKGHIVVGSGAHRRAVAIGSEHADLPGAFRIDMAARRPGEQPVALARFDLSPFLVEVESFDPAGIL